jgi:hypothetical protein
MAKILNIPQKLMCKRLGIQLMALLGGGGTFRRWGLLGVTSLMSCPWSGYGDPGLSLCLSFTTTSSPLYSASP